MKAIKEFSFCKSDEVWEYVSKVCSVACSIEYDYPQSDLNEGAQWLTQSFFNQWLFVVNAYDKLQNGLVALNSHSDKSENAAHISPYVSKSISKENQFRDDAYLLIISVKTCLDLFACVIDLAENKIVRKNMLDIAKLKDKITSNPAIIRELAALKDEKLYPWVGKLTDVRNKLIHRGYHIKPMFEFKKSEELIVRIYRGTNLYTDFIDIDVGKLFEDFIKDMQIIDTKIGDILGTQFLGNIPVEASFTRNGLVNIYNYKDLTERI